ncbi:MAG: retroviral-like aspartic protease family protein [Vulcanimicrobiota bacterium]
MEAKGKAESIRLRHGVIVKQRAIHLAVLSLALAVSLTGWAIEVPLSKSGGVYELPVTLNGMLTLKFVVDSGAAEVSVPAEAVMILMRAGTTTEKDFLPGSTFILADGSKVKSPRFLIRKLQIGDIVLNDVKASIGSKGSSLLLGQSCLEKLPGWRLDTTREVFIIGEARSSGRTISPENAFCLQAASNGRLVAVCDLVARGAYETELTYNPKAAYQVAKELFEAKSQTEGIIKATAELTCKDPDLEAGLKRCHDCAVAYMNEIDRRIAFYSKKGESSWAEMAALKSTANDSLMLSLESVAKNFAVPRNKLAFENWKRENPVEAEMATSSSWDHLGMSPGRRFLGIRFTEDKGELVVAGLTPDSPNRGAGILPGDKLNTLNHQRVGSLADVKAVVNKSVGGTVSAELTRPPGNQIQKDLRVGRYAPWGKKFYKRIAVAPFVNESISDVGSYRNFLQSQLLTKVPRDTYFVWSAPKTESGLALETLKRDDVDFLLKVTVHTCEVHSAYRAFSPGNRVRVGEFKATFTLIDVSSGATAWEQELSHEMDQFNDVDATLKRCTQVVTEQAITQIAQRLFSR